MLYLTSSSFDELIDFVSSIHGAKIEQLYYWPRILQFWGIIWRRGKLLDDSSTNTSGRLFSLEHRAIAKVTFNEENHLIILHQDLIPTDIIEPSL